MIWNVDGRGFLPNVDPLLTLPINDFRNTELVYTWENLAHNVPYFLKEDCLREELISVLRKSSAAYYHGCVDALGDHQAYERAFLLLTYFATAYVNAPEGRRKRKLPKELTIPLVRAAHLVNRQPVLDFTAYILWNWKLKSAGDYKAQNFEPLVTFTDTEEENLLIGTMVEFEFLCSRLKLDNWNLYYLAEVLHHVNDLLGQLWKKMDKSFLRQYFQDFENIVYEGWDHNPKSYSCDVLLQSPMLGTICKYLDIGFRNDYLRSCSETIVRHRQSDHAGYIRSMPSTRERCRHDNGLTKAYNDCLLEISALYNNLAFRASGQELETVREEFEFFKI